MAFVTQEDEYVYWTMHENLLEASCSVYFDEPATQLTMFKPVAEDG